MQRNTIIQMLSRQTMFKKAVIEMLEHEIKILEKETEFHKTLLNAGETEVPDNEVYDDKVPPTVEKP